MNNTICLIKGLPGSGKSYLADQLVELEDNSTVVAKFSTDNYFMNSVGDYIFDPTKLEVAHKYTHARVRIQVDRYDKRNKFGGLCVVLVDNTFTQAWECSPYYEIAKDYGWDFELREPETSWKFDVDECYRRNQHNVPLETIKKMLKRWETSGNILKQLQSERQRRLVRRK